MNQRIKKFTKKTAADGNLKDYIKIAIFGGTFNPIHLGHLRLAEDVREEFSLDKIVFIPTNVPPHKKLEGNASASDRLEMIKLSIDKNDYFIVDDVEIKKGGISYTIDTIKYIYENYKFYKKPFFIIGSDQAITIKSWKKIDELATLLKFIILIRKEERSKIQELNSMMKELNLESYFFTKRELDITSSEIRDRIYNGKSVRYLIKDSVYDYIIKNKLYDTV